jgi:hypothetical protein
MHKLCTKQRQPLTVSGDGCSHQVIRDAKGVDQRLRDRAQGSYQGANKVRNGTPSLLCEVECVRGEQ